MFRVWKTLHRYSRAFLQMCFPDACAGCAISGALLCKDCVGALPSAQPHANALTRYTHPAVKKLIWRLKYKRDIRVAHIFAPLLARRIKARVSNTPVALVPIPLSPKRKKRRGYNQAEVLAHALKDIEPETFLLHSDVLIKTRETRPQTECRNKGARQNNIADAFHASIPQECTDIPIVVIDDVTTTGATLAEAKRALVAAGARSISAWTIAH